MRAGSRPWPSGWPGSAPPRSRSGWASSPNGTHLIDRTLPTAVNRAAEEMRELENARLDSAQAAIWSKVLAGDYRAVIVFLQISPRRAKLNGLDSPSSVVISPHVRGRDGAYPVRPQHELMAVTDDGPD